MQCLYYTRPPPFRSYPWRNGLSHRDKKNRSDIGYILPAADTFSKKHIIAMKTFLLSILCCFLFAAGIQAQPDKKTAPALHSFLNTEFMLKFRDLRIECESKVLQTQAASMQLDPQLVFRLRSAHDQTATRANQLLENIKQDFLNEKKLKSIAEFPEMYSDGLRFKLQDISDFYNTNFMQALADASIPQEQVDGGAILLLVVELVGLVNGLTKHFSDIRREARFYNDKYLQDNLVKPYRWQYWDELAGGNSRYEQFDRPSELIRPDASRDEMLQQRLQRVNETVNQVKNSNTQQGAPADWQYQPDPIPATPPADSTGGQWSPLKTKATTTTPEPAGKKTDTKKVETPAKKDH